MELVTWTWLMWISWAVAVPLPWESNEENRVRDGSTGTNPKVEQMIPSTQKDPARMAYAVVALICAVVLALVLGLRAKTLKNNILGKMKFTSVLVAMLFFMALSFLFSAAVVASGQAVITYQLCHSAAVVCLFFYVGAKVLLYVFFLERVRMLKTPSKHRCKDWLWVSGAFIICGGFLAITVTVSVSPMVELSSVDGHCRLGLPSRTSFPLNCFDIGVNLVLALVFLWLLLPLLRCRRANHKPVFPQELISLRLKGKTEKRGGLLCPDPRPIAEDKAPKRLLWQSLLGSSLLTMATGVKITLFYVLGGRELTWICLTVCTLEVTWGTVIVAWLMAGCPVSERDGRVPLLEHSVLESEGPVPSTILNSRISEPGERPPPAVLQDAGKLLDIDEFVSPIRRSHGHWTTIKRHE